MIRIGIIGDIGSGKSYVAKQFGFPFSMLILKSIKFIKKIENVLKN